VASTVRRVVSRRGGAQQALRMIGLLESRSSNGMANRLAGFCQGLTEDGFVDAETYGSSAAGRTIEPIVYRRWLPILSASSPM
jgi:hypothetical protein